MEKIDIENLDLRVLRRVKYNKAKENKFLPLYIKNNTLTIVKNKEILLESEEEIKFIYDKELKIINIDSESVSELIFRGFIGEKENLLSLIIKKAIIEKASDIHFEPHKEEVFIRMRIDGKLSIYTKILHLEYQKLISKIKVLGNMDITEKRRPQDGKASMEVDNKNYDLRLSTIPIIYGEKLVIRILYNDVFNHKLDELNMTSIQRNKLKKIISINNGLVLINGPTGSGKSTTLYSILNEINNKEVNITTLEDPIEVFIEGINQVSLNKKADITFASGLKSILRQDPDILMVGEIRDEETADIAVKASLTGHKVYSTIHTKAPKDVYFRLEDMGIKSYLIKDSLVGIISQRLIRILCNKCKRVEKQMTYQGKNIDIYKSEGCSFCNYTGYKGRKLVSSVVYVNEEIKKENSIIFQEIRSLSNDEMVENLNELIINGDISIEDFNSFLIEEGLNYEKIKIIP